MKLSITAETGQALAPFLRRHLLRAFTLLPERDRRGLPLRELNIVLVTDRTMRELHHEFMDDDTTTDVLTFPIDTDARGRVTSGEVYVCIPQARRQARLRGIPPQREVLLYAIHGMLHLLGHDDRTARGYHAMHRTEDELLTQLGLGPVFAPPRARTSAKGKPQWTPKRGT